MSTVGAKYLNLGDWARSIDPNGKIAKIIEILMLTNEILMDMPFVQGNLPTGHRTSIRSGLPTVAWRKLYEGVQPSKSRKVTVTDSIGMLEGYSEVDKKLADLNGNTAEFRLSEDKAFIESLNQEMATTAFYGNTDTDPEKFLGLSARYDDLSAENAENIISGGGTGADNTSIWLIGWSNETIHGIFPKGGMTGIKHEDKGQETLTDANGGLYEGYRAHYLWEMGLTLKDWRAVSRQPNIDVSDLSVDASTGANLITNMIKQIHKIPKALRRSSRMVFYVNETIETYLDLQTLNQSNMNITYGKDAHGEEVMKFRGIPVKRCDALLEAESVVS